MKTRRESRPANTRGSKKRLATTIRFDPEVHRLLQLFLPLTGKSLNTMVNESMKQSLYKHTAGIETDLRGLLARIEQVRKADPDFRRAIADFVDAESRYGAEDPAEGGRRPGRVQSRVRRLLQG